MYNWDKLYFPTETYQVIYQMREGSDANLLVMWILTLNENKLNWIIFTILLIPHQTNHTQDTTKHSNFNILYHYLSLCFVSFVASTIKFYT